MKSARQAERPCFQEACARVLLFRGADTTIVNKSNQTPYELALVSQNSSIATIIQSHKADHVVPFRETPIINPKRRSIYIEQDKHSGQLSLTSRSQSMPKLNGVNLLRRSNSPSNDHFSQQHPSSRSSSPKSCSDHGFGSECASHLGINNCYSYKRKRLYAAAPGRKCVCVKSYCANASGELSLTKGDIVESKKSLIHPMSKLLFCVVLSVGEQGYLEGRCRDTEGWFPSHHVQDICVFSMY